MEENHKTGRSQLFTLRIWREEVGHGRFEIRGQVKHVSSGETAYFREWSFLQSFLNQQLQIESTFEMQGKETP